ncbi:MAG: hypothetical protein WBX38_15040 [Candidatus Sulfotelmatobacter sp.]
MHGRLCLTRVFWLVFLTAIALISNAPAQGGPDIFITPIPNSPFAGVVNVERSKVLPNGYMVDLKTFREVGRDSRGRIHNEARTEVPAASGDTPKLIRIHLYDPQSRVSTMIDPAEKTFRTATVNHPPSTEPPSTRYAMPPGQGAAQNEFAKEEDLGVRDMEGVQVRGVRQKQTIPAESSETGKEIVITDEHWYSEDLRINMLVKHSDPRTGTVTMTVTQVRRTEPDAAFFEVPAGYNPP